MNGIISTTSSDRARKTFYPTPEALSDKLLRGIRWAHGISILEPSAGKGDLAKYCAGKIDYAWRHYPPHDARTWKEAITGSDIDCIEIDASLRSTLEGEGFRVVHDDFMTFETQKRYDLIVMNPPFDAGCEHLLKAMDISSRGGMIFCILNAETLRNPYTYRREELLKKLDAYGAEIEYVQNAFSDAERQTDVEVALVRVNIPKVPIDNTIMDEMRRAPTYKTQKVPNTYTEIAQYSEIEKWVNMHNYEAACGIRLIEECAAMNEALGDTILNINLYGKNDAYSSVDINHYLREVRLKYWRKLFDQPVITSKFTTNLLNELHDSVNKLADYEFSAYNIMTLIIKMNGKTIKGIEDTIIKLFDDWTATYWHEDSPNRHYYNGWCTNDCFRVGAKNGKVIIHFYGAYDDWSKKFRSNNVLGKFRDIEKVFDFLDCGRTDWQGSIDNAFKAAEETQNTKNIDTKFFTVTFFKKGTAHFVFKDMDLLEKFNMFASQKKGWLPPDYGKKHYKDMTNEEKAVVDSFQGRDKYEEVMARSDYFLNTGSQTLMIGAGIG